MSLAKPRVKVAMTGLSWRLTLALSQSPHGRNTVRPCGKIPGTMARGSSSSSSFAYPDSLTHHFSFFVDVVVVFCVCLTFSVWQSNQRAIWKREKKLRPDCGHDMDEMKMRMKIHPFHTYISAILWTIWTAYLSKTIILIINRAYSELIGCQSLYSPVCAFLCVCVCVCVCGN